MLSATHLDPYPWAKGLVQLCLGLAVARARPGPSTHHARRQQEHLAHDLASLMPAAPELAGAEVFLQAESAQAPAMSLSTALCYQQACTRLQGSPFVVVHALALAAAAAASASSRLRVASTSIAQQAEQRYRDWSGADASGWAGSNTQGERETPASTSDLGAQLIPSPRVPTMLSDLHAAVAATQALAGETSSVEVVDRIIEALRLLSSATRVALVILVQGATKVAIDTASQPDDLPHQLIHYVVRRREPVSLESLARPTIFEPYFVKHPTGSAVCVPWRAGQGREGAIYLENALTEQAFSIDRIRVIEFLAVQAATALSNAAVCADMQAAAQARVQLAEAAHREAEHARRAQLEMQMAGGFAHEMRNALAAARFALSTVTPWAPGDGPGRHQDHAARLLGCADLLHSDNPVAQSPVLRQHLAALKESFAALPDVVHAVSMSLERSMRVVQRIMTFARAARERPATAACILRPIVDDILRHQADPMLARGITVHVAIDPTKTVPLEASHAATLMRELVSNALDALAATNTPSREMRLAVLMRDDAVCISCEDNGNGIAEQDRERVFDPFYSTKGVQAVGLGLSIVRRLTQMHRGYVQICACPAGGARIELCFSALTAEST